MPVNQDLKEFLQDPRTNNSIRSSVNFVASRFTVVQSGKEYNIYLISKA